MSPSPTSRPRSPRPVTHCATALLLAGLLLAGCAAPPQQAGPAPQEPQEPQVSAPAQTAARPAPPRAALTQPGEVAPAGAAPVRATAPTPPAPPAQRVAWDTRVPGPPPRKPDTPEHAQGDIVLMSFTGLASWYGKRFHGRRTASGERFDMAAMTAAHPSLPFGSQVRVTNLANDRSVVVMINDRGPFVKSRVIDVSHAAARQLGMLERGVAEVRVELLSGDER